MVLNYILVGCPWLITPSLHFTTYSSHFPFLTTRYHSFKLHHLKLHFTSQRNSTRSHWSQPAITFWAFNIANSLPADVLWGSLVTYSNEPKRTSAGRLHYRSMTSDGNWEVGGRGTGGVKIRICDSPSTTTTASCYPRKAPLVADIYLYKFEDVELGFITNHSMTGPSVNKLKLLYCFSWISRSFVALDFQLAYIRLNVFFFYADI